MLDYSVKIFAGCFCEFVICELAEVLKLVHWLIYLEIYFIYVIIRELDAHTYCNHPCLPTPGILFTRFDRWSEGSVNLLASVFPDFSFWRYLVTF